MGIFAHLFEHKAIDYIISYFYLSSPAGLFFFDGFPAVVFCFIGGLAMYFAAVLLLCAEYFFALALVRRSGLLKSVQTFIPAALLILSVFVLRLACFDHETLDYIDWISRWVGYFRDGGAWHMLGEELWACNYNVPYLYALALFSQLGLRDLYLVKLLSILFDVLLAFWSMKLVSLITDSAARRLTCFIGVLWLPTVFLNGACWGQCDSLYAAFAVLSLYLALSDHPIGSVIAIAVSFSIKLQAIFLMPVFLVLLFAKKIKLWHLFLFPAAYIVTLLPAVFAGRNFLDLLLLYYNNTSSIGEGLNYNSPSIYAVTSFSPLTENAAGALGIALAFGLCLAVFVWSFIRRRDLSARVLLGTALILCTGVPYFLPHMHERYFILADVLSFAAAVVCPWAAVGAALTSFGSLLGYYAYLRGRYALVISYSYPMMPAGLAMGAALLLSFVFTAEGLRAENLAKLEISS